MTRKSIWQRIRSLRSGPASGGGLIAGPGTPADSVPAVLSSGLAVVPRDQAAALGVDYFGRAAGSGRVVIVEPDGSLTGSAEDIERAAAYGMLRRWERPS